jgi:hypothetical protein
MCLVVYINLPHYIYGTLSLYVSINVRVILAELRVLFWSNFSSGAKAALEKHSAKISSSGSFVITCVKFLSKSPEKPFLDDCLVQL